MIILFLFHLLIKKQKKQNIYSTELSTRVFVKNTQESYILLEVDNENNKQTWKKEERLNSYETLHLYNQQSLIADGDIKTASLSLIINTNDIDNDY